MRARQGGTAFAFLLAAGAVGGLAINPKPGLTRPPAEAGKPDKLLPKSEGDRSTSVSGCKQCHIRPEPDGDFVKKYKSHTFVRLNESKTWSTEDPHSQAYVVLERDLGKQMSRILGYEVTNDARCLNCHATNTSVAGDDKPSFEDKDQGVNCNTCHGLRKPWQQAHYEDKNVKVADGKMARVIPWRTFTPAVKEESGLRNLRDPVVKAQFCATCHVGSPSEGKVVTHEMYAAGHPPLPPFELGTFVETEPRHWGLPVDEYGDGKDKLAFFSEFNGIPFGSDQPLDNWQWELYRFHPVNKETNLTRQVVSGAIASLHAEMQMLTADAKSASSMGVDFARFDCYACHHDLKYPSERQKRGYEWAPGRPTPKAWTAAMPSVIAEHAKSLPKFQKLGEDFEGQWAKVTKALTSRPFGDAAAVNTEAAAMADWCQKFLDAQAAETAPIYTPDESKRLLDMLAAAAVSDRWSADGEAAMHMAWAYMAVKGDRRPTPTEAAKGKLAGLGKVLPLAVRYDPYQNPDTKEPASVGERLEERAKRFRAYDAAAFIKEFKAYTGQ